ncbi:DNA-binding protein [Pseudomonas sp. NPDC090203]|uniref:DNA-binding protein n=1 Tax=Pseudomonas sp. NPDC090203 TaxID=3364477 RepID=UPI003820A412
MAVGVPENDVFAAADAVLARGERPTVERVRAELGRGSPARVAGLLDHWWARLAGRLRGETRLPELPTEVAQAFTAIWQQAAALAQEVVEQSLVQQHRVLEAERAELAALEERVRQEQARQLQQLAVTLAAQQSAERRLLDLQQLLDQHAHQVEDLTRQRQVLQEDRDAARSRIEELEQHQRADRREAEQVRKEQETYARGLEERAHQEIDRAREETKSAPLQTKQLGKQVEVLQQRCEDARLRLSEAQQQVFLHKTNAEREVQQVQQKEARLELVQAELQEAIQRAVAQEARADTLAHQIILLQPAATAESRKSSSRKAR